ncbi:glycosyl hydrolase family 28-related protein [Pedobacter sp. ASV1-7]|uniref:glycosyl hydrolase family 28-related protein n=1 Tax=Pedobacter sp. ASV1-7 TaxID=3145237 RepID=UPI0032E88090
MSNLKSLFLLLMICIHTTSKAIKIDKHKSDPEIMVAKSATHIAKITNNQLVIISGSTYSFTVDTPEDKGLVSTGIDVKQIAMQLRSKDGSVQKYRITNKDGTDKNEGEILNGDQLVVTSADGRATKVYQIITKAMAIASELSLLHSKATLNTSNDLTLFFTAGQRTPKARVQLFLPAGIEVTPENTTVNVIGRGTVKLKDLNTQSIGRFGANYSYSKVGTFTIRKKNEGGSILTFNDLDLRPSNGPDLILTIQNVKLKKIGEYAFSSSYTTSEPEILNSPTTGRANTILKVTATVSSFERIVSRELHYTEHANRYTSASFKWGINVDIKHFKLLQSVNNGKNWTVARAVIDTKKATAKVSGLLPDTLYMFKLDIKHGPNKGLSNELRFYTGKIDVKHFGANGNGQADDTQKINDAIDSLNKMGGGSLLFSAGTYNVRTVHLKSNVYLFIDKKAIIAALKGADPPERTWFSDKKYRSGLSPTDIGPYADPENYMTKQDVGHHYFRNTMFFGERLDNVKIIGNGLITGNGNLVTSDKVMNNPVGHRADKMFTLKLCSNLEIGGIYRPEDLWYDAEIDEPYYIGEDGSKITDLGNMLQIDQAGHFVLLATGTDNIYVHNTYFGKNNQGNARDIYDFMSCNNVTANNIYSKVSSDDIIKPGSDCSLGFTRPAKKYMIRNIIGDTNCNLFQIGSETADDIKDVCIDNIYVLGANKAGFSISTNDGAHISDIHLNCGHTGKLHSRSKMYRTRAPFFISISNRGRIIGASAGRYTFTENGKKHDELLIKDVNIGKVENIIINGIDIMEVYGGSSYSSKNSRWNTYNETQNKATPIIAGYKLPETETVTDGLDFKLPNGLHTGYIKNISFNDVHILVKGGNPVSDVETLAPELGVGQYNVGNLGVQPSYGIWARHVKGLKIENSSFNYEKQDSRYAIFLDDVIGASMNNLKVVQANDNPVVIKLKNSSDIVADNIIYFNDKWDSSTIKLPAIRQTEKSSAGFPKF